MVTWLDVWLSQLWSLGHRAARPVSTCVELRWACHRFSVCRSSVPPAPATMPGLCTVCVIRLVLTISNNFPCLSTLHYHTTNLGSISADFHPFSTERVCPPLLNSSSIAHCISSVPSYTILFSHFLWLHFLQTIKQTKQRQPWDYSRGPDETQVSIYKNTGFF